MLLHLHPENPQLRLLSNFECLKDSGMYYLPNPDTFMGLVATFYNHKAIERICKIKNMIRKKRSYHLYVKT